MALIFPGATPADQTRNRDQWGRILSSISRTEGMLDAGATYDGGICSIGFQQWSMHVPNEGPLLLERMKNLSDVYYDVIVRALDIETGPAATGVASPSGVPVSQLDDPIGFLVLTSGATPQPYPGGAAAAAITVADKVFDWSTIGTTRCTGKRAMLLAARWSVVARYAPELWQAQAECGSWRFHRTAAIVRSDARWPDVQRLNGYPTEGTSPLWVAPLDLFSSETLAALIIDMAINSPAYVAATMRRAVVRAIAALSQDGMAAQRPDDTFQLDDRFRLALTVAFLAERRFAGTTFRRNGLNPELRTEGPDLRAGGLARAAARFAGYSPDSTRADPRPRCCGDLGRRPNIPARTAVGQRGDRVASSMSSSRCSEPLDGRLRPGLGRRSAFPSGWPSRSVRESIRRSNHGRPE